MLMEVLKEVVKNYFVNQVYEDNVRLTQENENLRADTSLVEASIGSATFSLSLLTSSVLRDKDTSSCICLPIPEEVSMSLLELKLLGGRVNVNGVDVGDVHHSQIVCCKSDGQLNLSLVDDYTIIRGKLKGVHERDWTTESGEEIPGESNNATFEERLALYMRGDNNDMDGSDVMFIPEHLLMFNFDKDFIKSLGPLTRYATEEDKWVEEPLNPMDWFLGLPQSFGVDTRLNLLSELGCNVYERRLLLINERLRAEHRRLECMLDILESVELTCNEQSSAPFSLSKSGSLSSSSLTWIISGPLPLLRFNANEMRSLELVISGVRLFSLDIQLMDDQGTLTLVYAFNSNIQVIGNFLPCSSVAPDLTANRFAEIFQDLSEGASPFSPACEINLAHISIPFEVIETTLERRGQNVLA